MTHTTSSQCYFFQTQLQSSSNISFISQQLNASVTENSQDFFQTQNNISQTRLSNDDDYNFNDSQEQLSFSSSENLSYFTQLNVPTPASNHSKLTTKFIQDETIDPKIPASISGIYNEIKAHYSDWTFISILTGQLCNKKFPMGTYHNLKLALLMSLVTSNESPMHIIAIGKEMSHINEIMRQLGEFAERFIPMTNGNASGINTKKNGTNEAGPLVMAASGIAFVGHWQQLRPKIKIQFLREIETNSVMQKDQKHIKLESTVWAHWRDSKKFKKDTASIDQFLSVFGIPIVTNDQIDEEILVFDLLSKVSEDWTEKSNGFEIPEEDIRTFVANLRNQEVIFDPQAELMIKNYFNATKIVRKHALTIKAVEMLRKMSAAHAKLCLRSNVMNQDVLSAIAICERFIKVLYGVDANASPNESIVKSIEDIDAFQSKLFEWYTCFTKDILERI